VGILFALLGGLVFFEGRIILDQRQAILLSLLGVLLITIYGLLARSLTRSGKIDPISLTAIPMGFGSLFLLTSVWPIPMPSLRVLGILAWMTLINSAGAFVLWNQALRHMQAFEISIAGNLMPIGTALLAPILVGEPVPGNAWLGMGISLIGIVLVGLGGKPLQFRNRDV
jgi:drug/metabolite transporter (DMT)-like permease